MRRCGFNAKYRRLRFSSTARSIRLRRVLHSLDASKSINCRSRLRVVVWNSTWLQDANSLKSCRITGREGSRRATVLNPSRLNAQAVPVNTLAVLPGLAVSIGYASTADALAHLAVLSASRIRADITPFL